MAIDRYRALGDVVISAHRKLNSKTSAIRTYRALKFLGLDDFNIGEFMYFYLEYGLRLLAEVPQLRTQPRVALHISEEAEAQRRKEVVNG